MIEQARRAIVNAAGTDLRLLVLYGSEARGEATSESDIDVLAVIDTDDPRVTRRLRDAVYEVMWDCDFPRLISLHIMRLVDFEAQKRAGYSFIRSVEEEGKVLWPAA